MYKYEYSKLKELANTIDGKKLIDMCLRNSAQNLKNLPQNTSSWTKAYVDLRMRDSSSAIIYYPRCLIFKRSQGLPKIQKNG